MKIPYGFCRCGCGRRTKIATKTFTKRGHVKGEPMPFLPRHFPTASLEIRFWSKVAKGAPNECWEWLGARRGHAGMQYGCIKAGPWSEGAHRVSYALAHGVSLDALDHVIHTCDNPGCVNPAHLRAGTRQDNVDDMVSKRRHPFGERAGRAKLTSEDVNAIRASAARGVDLANKYGVTPDQISRIRHHRSWSLAS